jgi:hypothetical protein
MKRLLIPILTVAFLAFTAMAAAQGCYMSSKAGAAFGSAATTGTCGVSKVSLTKSAKVGCGLAGGGAAVRYGFTLNDGCGPSVSPTVDWVGTPPAVSVANVAPGKVRVTVRVSGAAATTVISRVTVSYYC